MGFLLFWLCGWAAGEVFALRQLFARSPTGDFAFGRGFLLFWLAAWTMGGLTALNQILRMTAGSAELRLRSDGLHVRRGIGALGRSRRVEYADITAVSTSGNRLSVETTAGAVPISDLGSAAEREWLCGTLRRAFGLTPRSSPRIPEAGRATQPPPEPAGWMVQRQDDGGVILCQSSQTRWQGIGCLLFFTLFWDGIVGVFVATGLGFRSREGYEGPAEVGSLGYWLFLTPHMLIGICLLAFLLYSLFVTEERYAARNRLEIRKRGFSREWTCPLPAGYFTLDSHTDEGRTTYKLVLVSEGKRKHLESGDEASVSALGAFLAYYTGWEFRAASKDLGRR